MPRKCSVTGCKTGYDSQKFTSSNNISVFSFPLKDKAACQAWIDAIPTNGLEVWQLTHNHGVCAKHWPDDLPAAFKRTSGRHLVPSIPPCTEAPPAPPPRSLRGRGRRRIAGRGRSRLDSDQPGKTWKETHWYWKGKAAKAKQNPAPVAIAPKQPSKFVPIAPKPQNILPMPMISNFQNIMPVGGLNLQNFLPPGTIPSNLMSLLPNLQNGITSLANQGPIPLSTIVSGGQNFSLSIATSSEKSTGDPGSGEMVTQQISESALISQIVGDQEKTKQDDDNRLADSSGSNSEEDGSSHGEDAEMDAFRQAFVKEELEDDQYEDTAGCSREEDEDTDQGSRPPSTSSSTISNYSDKPFQPAAHGEPAPHGEPEDVQTDEDKEEEADQCTAAMVTVKMEIDDGYLAMMSPSHQTDSQSASPQDNTINTSTSALDTINTSTSALDTEPPPVSVTLDDLEHITPIPQIHQNKLGGPKRLAPRPILGRPGSKRRKPNQDQNKESDTSHIPDNNSLVKNTTLVLPNIDVTKTSQTNLSLSNNGPQNVGPPMSIQKGMDRHVAFFKSLLPTLQTLSERETLQYQAQILATLQNIQIMRAPVPAQTNILPLALGKMWMPPFMPKPSNL